jgi:hypothetical protein
MAGTSIDHAGEAGVLRKIKAHKKSRKGCGNCKLRKVKVGMPRFCSPYSAYTHFSAMRQSPPVGDANCMGPCAAMIP